MTWSGRFKRMFRRLLPRSVAEATPAPSVPNGPGLHQVLISGRDGGDAWFRDLFIAFGKDGGPSRSGQRTLEDIHRLLRGHELPSLEQTSAFAEHICRNHSWYKHLPHFPPGAWFTLALNPNAGRQLEWWNGSYVYHDVPEGEYMAHHSRLATSDYRRHFGIWDYSDYPDTADASTLALFPEACRCRLTSFLRPHHSHFTIIHGRSRDSSQRHLGPFLEYARQFPDDPDVARYRVLEHWLKAMPPMQSIPKENWQVAKAFTEAEGRIQQQRLGEALGRAREWWGQFLNSSSP